MNITATRYHDFCAGHRVYGHESKCAGLHGHNYRVHFTISAKGHETHTPGDFIDYALTGKPLSQLDAVGRVLDFSAIKATLCAWLEEQWDHNFLLWDQDPLSEILSATTRTLADKKDRAPYNSLVCVPFNPTAENMAAYLLNEIGPRVLPSSVRLISVRIDETRKCSAEASL